MRWLDSIMDMNLRELWERVKDREAWHAVVHVCGSFTIHFLASGDNACIQSSYIVETCSAWEMLCSVSKVSILSSVDVLHFLILGFRFSPFIIFSLFFQQSG